MMHRIAHLIRTQLLGLIALMLVLTGGVAYAATVAKNSVTSRSIVNGQVKTVDLGTGAVKGPKIAADGVNGTHVSSNSLTGDDLAESTLTTVPNAATLGGRGPGSFLSSAVYKKESAFVPGTDLADGTSVLGVACNAGDILLSGGPASVNAASDLVESFPSPGTTNGWSARIHKNGAADSFSVVILCLDQ
jgi:hypothetical protein